jgi:hypothetical protein
VSSPVNSPVRSVQSSTLKIASTSKEPDDTDNKEFDELSPDKREPLVRVETGFGLKSIRAKELCDSDHVKFDAEQSIWLVEDNKLWLVVTVFPEYGCSCKESPNCCHVLAVKTKLGMRLRTFTFQPTASLSGVIASRTTGNSKQSKRKYQTRNTTKAGSNSGCEVIANDEHHVPFLIQLINSDNIMPKLSASQLFDETEIETDSQKLTEIFLGDLPDLSVCLSVLILKVCIEFNHIC